MHNEITLVLFRNLGIALAIGLLVGLERGWQHRDADEGQRVAGVRTLAIVGLAGGVCGLLAVQLTPVILALALVAAVCGGLFKAILAAWLGDRKLGIRVGIAGIVTAIVGLLSLFWIGALA